MFVRAVASLVVLASEKVVMAVRNDEASADYLAAAPCKAPHIFRDNGCYLPYCEDQLDALRKVEPGIDEYIKRSSVGFEDEEISRARIRSGLNHAKCQKHPKAVYILGPSSVGKSTATATYPEQGGLEKRSDAKDSDAEADGNDGGEVRPETPYDAVVLDGDIWREHHPGFRNLLKLGSKHNCIFKSAWDGVISFSKKQKKMLWEAASDKSCRRNLIIPETCSTVQRCVDQSQHLKRLGYVISVIAIYAPKVDVFHRGHTRADRTGKHYSASFNKPIAAQVPMLALGSNSGGALCLTVDNTQRPAKEVLRFKCPGLDTFDPEAWPKILWTAREHILRVTGLSEEAMKQAEESHGYAAAIAAAQSS